MAEHFTMLTFNGLSKEQWFEFIESTFEFMEAQVKDREPNLTDEQFADLILFNHVIGEWDEETDDTIARFKEMNETEIAVYKDMDSYHRAQIRKEIEKERDGLWRINNGEKWTHDFDDQETAMVRCREWGGMSIGRASYNEKTGACSYVDVVYP